MTEPAFQKPQFPLLPDPHGLRNYANVSNTLEIAFSTGTRRVALAVPTGLFTLMKDVFNVLPEDRVQLGIVEEEGADDPGFVFYMVHKSSVYDLWRYSSAGLPAWMRSPTYWVK